MVEVEETTEKQLGGITGKGFMPGQSGNPNGRPPGTYSLKVKIEKALRENPELEAKLVADLLEKEQGLVYQMIDGRPKQITEAEVKMEVKTDPDTKQKIEGNIDSLLGLNN